jgi:hypothetical protein
MIGRYFLEGSDAAKNIGNIDIDIDNIIKMWFLYLLKES